MPRKLLSAVVFWSIPANMFARVPSLLGVEPEPPCQAVLLPDN